MKARLLAVLGLVLGLALLLAWGVAAQGPEPPLPPPRGGSSQPLTDWGTDRPFPYPTALGGGLRGQGVGAAAVGTPGLAFRYVTTFGETEVAYFDDTDHLNRPTGLFMDGSDNLYVADEYGHRMLKYRTSDGANLLSIGTAGLRYHDEYVFSYPKDVAVDPSGYIWVVDEHRLTQYDGGGNYVQVFPDWDDCPWCSGDDNQHFDLPVGIAFDSEGRLYVSDHYNHRVQVYTITVTGSVVYSTTIGETGVPGSDNSHFNHPQRMVVDGSDQLYVADTNNHRIQRCAYAAGWTCATFHGGSQGSGLNQLSWATGLGIDGSSNIYIAEIGNSRVKKCPPGGSGGDDCPTFGSGFDWPLDVAVDSAGNVYVSDYNDFSVKRFNSSGVLQGIFAGTSGVPYLTDDSHFNTPYGVAVDSELNLYVATRGGYRVLKLDASGGAQWAIGTPGVWGAGSDHFGDYWSGPNDVAVDASGNVYVADTGNHRIQTHNSMSGTYVATLGNYGSGDDQFHDPYGVAVDGNGNIYVADEENHRVQIFNSSRVYTATLGETDVPGQDNAHFSGPRGVGVDGSGNVFVADGWNRRVQKCTLAGVCNTLAGTVNESGWDFDHLAEPYDVALDALGRIYVADAWNDRVQVFDASGAYLTTIGGAWGSGSGQFRGAVGVDVDAWGNVYVADEGNHRIQKFAPGVLGWTQVNINGFGDVGNKGWSTVGVYSDSLYVATNNGVSGSQIWRTDTGTEWTQVNSNGFGDTNNSAGHNMVDFNDYLYVGTRNEGTGGEVWRCAASSGCDEPSDWSQVGGDGLGDAKNVDVEPGLEFGGCLYLGGTNWVSGTLVYSTSDGTTYEQVNEDGFGDGNNETGIKMAAFGDFLYMGTVNWSTGGELWRCPGASGCNEPSDWDQVGGDGFGDADSWGLFPLAEFKGGLYVGVGNGIDGARVYSSTNGIDWSPVNADGFGDVDNDGVYRGVVFGNELYVAVSNWTTGVEIWKTGGGTTWEQVPPDGFGDSNNLAAFPAVFNSSLYVATMNSANGAEVWRMGGGKVYLPIILKNE